MVAALSKPVDDLLDIFGDAPATPPVAPRPAARPTAQPSCGMQAEREKDFWDSVAWKHQRFVFFFPHLPGEGC